MAAKKTVPPAAPVKPATPARPPPPPRRETMEVDMSWLEKDEAARAKSSAKNPAVRPGTGKSSAKTPAVKRQPPPLPAQPQRRETMEVRLEWLEEDAKSGGKSSARIPAINAKGGRKGPPTLPPPKEAPKKKHPPPLPREED